MNRGFETASKKYREQNPEPETPNSSQSSAGGGGVGGGGGMPDLGSLLGAFGGGRGGGGTPDLSSLLNNPMLVNMANQMAQSGAFNDIISNPRVRDMAQQMMSGERGIGDIMNDPEIQNLYHSHF